MIEKLTICPRPLPNNPMAVENIGMDNESLFNKINQLVDAVNKLQEEAENNARIRANHEKLIDTLVVENNIHEKQIDELQMKLEPEKCETRSENVQEDIKSRQENVQKETFVSIDEALKMGKKVDPFAKQRKCICKLCWFWNDNKADKVIGILTGVFDEADRPFERNIDQTLYKHCELVKPDDDIIYKGGDNDRNS